MDTVSETVTPAAIVSRRRCSTRQRPWYVYPRDETGIFDVDGNTHKIFCGHLFNAEAERAALGQSIGEGEECCIALEPIADARLSFAPGLWVQQLCREFTGVELCCGHRFSAVCLLWHWCLSLMVCPVCRAKFSLEGVPPTPCSIQNFPPHARNQLYRKIKDIRDKEDAENQRISTEYITENMMHEHVEIIMAQTIQSVLGNTRCFSVILSVHDDNSPIIVQCLQLHRLPEPRTNGVSETMRLKIQRADLGRFCSALSTVTTPEGIDQNRRRRLEASLVIPDPINRDHLIEVSRVRAIAMTPGRNTNAVTLSCVQILGNMTVEFYANDNSVPNGIVPRLKAISFVLDVTSLLETVSHLFAFRNHDGYDSDSTSSVSIDQETDIFAMP
jgi:hypothetical protein